MKQVKSRLPHAPNDAANADGHSRPTAGPVLPLTEAALTRADTCQQSADILLPLKERRDVVSDMKKWRSWIALTALVLAGCDPKPTRQAAVAHPVAPVAQHAATAPHRGPVAVPNFRGHRRYRGTVGNLPVTIELAVESKWAFLHGDSSACEGSYSYDRSGTPLSLYAVRFSPDKPLQLQETQFLNRQAVTGRWQALQPLGPAVSGTWTSADGKRRLPFLLREDYQDAVRYEVLTAAATGRLCDLEDLQGGINGPHATLAREYLHLLGPDTVRPGLRRLQCPVPARRRAQLHRDARRENCVYLNEEVGVGLNGYGLLSTDQLQTEEGFGRPHPSYRVSETVYDLHTGRVLTLADFLRPQTDSVLLQLIVPRLERYMAEFEDRELRKLDWEPQLPRGGFGLTSAGMVFSYDEGDGVASWPCPGQEVVVPYAELLPLLKPRSPLDALLRDRGLKP